MRLSVLRLLALSFSLFLAQHGASGLSAWGESAPHTLKQRINGTESFQFKSKSLARKSAYVVWTPPEKVWDGKKPLPLVVALHGLGGKGDDWFAPEHGNLDALLTQGMLKGELMPFIVVAPSEPKGYWTNHLNKPHARYGDLVDEVIDRVEQSYPTNGIRAITGVSMGGHGALSRAFAEPSRYVAAIAMAGAFFESPPTHRKLYKDVWGDPPNEEHWRKTAPREQVKWVDPELAPQLFLSAGRDDMPRFRPLSEAAVADFRERFLTVTYFETLGGHTWAAWREASEVWLPWLHERFQREESYLKSKTFLEPKSDSGTPSTP